MDYKIDEIFPEKFFCTLQKASLDTDKNIFMVDNEFIVLKLDDFNRKKYQKELGCSMCLRGGDACFEKNGKIYILEFKNTYLSIPCSVSIWINQNCKGQFLRTAVRLLNLSGNCRQSG